MQRLLALGLTLVAAASLSAQVPGPSGVDQILVTQQGSHSTNYILQVEGTNFYLGEPAVSVRAEALPNSTPRASRFTVRAWHEGDHARVVVSAVVPDPQVPTRELETAIATYPVYWNGGAPVGVSEMAEWGAGRMQLRAVRPMKR